MSVLFIVFFIFIGYTLIMIVEAWLEAIVIALKNDTISNYAELNKKEHFRSAVYAALVTAVIWIPTFLTYNCWQLLPAVLVNRRIFFDYLLILFRKRPNPSLYEGNDWWVQRFKAIFGPKGRDRELVVELAITLGSIVWFILSN